MKIKITLLAIGLITVSLFGAVYRIEAGSDWLPLLSGETPEVGSLLDVDTWLSDSPKLPRVLGLVLDESSLPSDLSQANILAQQIRSRGYNAVYVETSPSVSTNYIAQLKQSFQSERVLLLALNKPVASTTNQVVVSSNTNANITTINNQSLTNNQSLVQNKGLFTVWQENNLQKYSPFTSETLGVSSVVCQRSLGKPFMLYYTKTGLVTSRYSALNDIRLGMLAALQGWSGIWFDNQDNNPNRAIIECLIAMLYRRADLSILKERFPFQVNENNIQLSKCSVNDTYCPFAWVAWYAQLGKIDSGKISDKSLQNVPFYEACKNKTRKEILRQLGLYFREDGAFPRAGDGALMIDKELGSFTLSTPRICGGFAESGILRTSLLVAELQKSAAQVWVVSIDGQPIVKSNHLLLAHLTEIEFSGTEYSDSLRTNCIKTGSLPYLVRCGEARIRLRLGKGDWQVYALNRFGKRQQSIPNTKSRSFLSFNAKTALDLNQIVNLYEIVKIDK